MANSDYKVTTTRAADFTPLAELFEDVDYLDHTFLLGRSNFPRIDSLYVGMIAMCQGEFMRVTAIGAGSVQVTRGSADTVPHQHVKGSLVWFFDNSTMGYDSREHSAGETNSVKYAPYTIGGGTFPISASAIDVVTYNWRYYRPYAPGQVRARGMRWYIPQVISADQPNMLLTWTHRDRIQQADQLLDHDAGNVGPEPGTSYTIRIYDGAGTLKRTVSGVMAIHRNEYGQLIPPNWNYTWTEAMADLGFDHPEAESVLVPGRITLFTTRDGFDSWQGYEINFQVDTQGIFMKVAQLAELAAQSTPDGDVPPTNAVLVAQLAELAAQHPSAEQEGGVVAVDGMYVSQLAQGIGQETSFYSTLSRNLFESPYAWQAKTGLSGDTMLVTVAARPSDRLTDSHKIWTRYNWPRGSGAQHAYEQRVAPQFTPWATLFNAIDYMDDRIVIAATSFIDGVSFADVRPGQVAQVDAEIFRIESISDAEIILSRGCFDTVPARHKAGARVWMFEAQAGNDPTNYPLRLANGELGAAVEVKMVPDVYGPPLNLKDIPTDNLVMRRRVERPYPPGQVMVGDKRWYLGKVMVENEPVTITWVHRNRLEQGAATIDHLAPGFSPEFEQKYRLKITVWVYPEPPGQAYEVLIRQAIVDGTEFTYTWDMAKSDGYRAGSILGVCGSVTVGMTLFSIRDDLDSWQGYVIPLSLPARKCSPGENPGGGQLPPTNGGGNGDTGSGTPGGSTPGDPKPPGDNEGGGPKDPVDNGGGGDDGTGPPEPPEPPPDWPDPVDPPPTPDPGDPNTALKAHWDLNWDRHWDAYNKDNPGD